MSTGSDDCSLTSSAVGKACVIYVAFDAGVCCCARDLDTSVSSHAIAAYVQCIMHLARKHLMHTSSHVESA